MPAVSPNPDGPVDPFDLDALRAEPLEELDVVKVVTMVPVRRPKRDEFFRVHPSDDYSLQAWILEHETDKDREIYLVPSAMRAELGADARLVRLYTCMNKAGTVFLWPAKLPTAETNSGRAWHESALEAAAEATTLWIRMVGNRNLGAYEILKARGNLDEPHWPDLTLKELVEIAFKGDRVIRDVNHDVIRELHGEL